MASPNAAPGDGRVLAERDRRSRQNAVLAAIAAGIMLDQPMAETLQRVATALVAGTDAVASSISLLDPAGERIAIAAGDGLPPELYAAESGTLVRSLPGSERLFVEGLPLVLPDLGKDLAGSRDFSRFVEAFEEIEIRSVVVVPLRFRGKPVGALNGYYAVRGGPPAEEVELLTAVANQVAVSIENARLFQAAERGARENAALAEIAASITLGRPVRETLDRVAASIVTATAALTATISMMDVAYGGMVLVGGAGLPPGFMDAARHVANRNNGPRAEAIEQSEPVVTHGLRAMLLADTAFTGLEEGIRAAAWDTLISLPILFGGRPVGALQVAYEGEQEPSANEWQLLGAIGDQLAVAIENARLFMETERRASENAALAGIAAAITLGDPGDGSLDTLATRMADAAGATACAVYLVSTEDGGMMMHGVHGVPRWLWEAMSSPLAPGSQRQAALAAGEAIVVPDIRERLHMNPLAARRVEGIAGLPWRSAVYVPILARGRPVGVFIVVYEGNRTPEPEDIRLLTALSRQAAIALENARLFEEAGQRVAELEAYADIAASLTRTQPVASTLLALVRRLTAVTPLAAAAVSLSHGESGMRLVAGDGLPDGYFERLNDLGAGWLRDTMVAASGEGLLVVNDFRERALIDPRLAAMKETWQAVDWETALFAPIRYEGRTTGVLAGYLPRGVAASSRLKGLMQATADHAAVAIENVRLFEEAKQRVAELEALGSIAASLTFIQPLETTLQTLVERVTGVTPCIACAVQLQDPANSDGQLVAQRGMEADYLAVMQNAEARPAWGPAMDAALNLDGVFVLDEAPARMLAEPVFATVRHSLVEAPWSTLVIVPLRYQGRSIGLLAGAFRAGFQPARRDIDLLRAIADQAAVAAESARLFTETRLRANENRALADIAASITVDQSMRTTLDTISRSVVSASRAVACAVFLMDPERNRIAVAGGEGIPRQMLDAIEASIPASRAFAVETLEENHSIFSAGARARMVADPAFASIAPMVVDMDWESILVLPVVYRGQPIGTINAAFPANVRPAPHEEAILQAIANQAAIAIQNARLYGQAQELAAVEERQRLARELHDSISQALYGVALGARTARTLLDRDPAKAIEPVEYVLSLAEAGLAEMRALIFELRPESLAMEGVAAAIEKQVASTQARYGVRVEASICAEPDVALDIKEAFYRVAQEALHNVVKHARATEATLALSFDSGVLRLELADNGQGFEPDGEFPGHLGLRSMRERIGRIGGTLTIASSPGAGASLCATVPSPPDPLTRVAGEGE